MTVSRLVRSWPLTGRDEELKLIKECFAGMDSAGVAIIGPAGVGKSRLADEAANAALAAGAVVRRTVATESARTIPLGAFLEWTAGASGGPLQLVGCVIDALTKAPEGHRVVVAVDDAHLLDELSAFVLHQLVLHRTASVIVSIRSGEQIPDAVTALWKDRHLDRLELQPLSQIESGTLLRHGLGGAVDRGCEQRMWALTRGNVLFLRHLVEQEIRQERLVNEDAIWWWKGDPTISSRLNDLIESQVGSVPQHVLDVVDMVAISEPLNAHVLAGLVPPRAVEDAEQRGLVHILPSRSGPAARIGHPLYGEVRRSQASPLRLRRLRGMVAKALSQSADPDINDPVRVGVLWAGSDLQPDPQLLMRAAEGAFMRLDLALAERLADASVKAGGGPDPAILCAHVLQHLNQVEKSQALLASLNTAELDDKQLCDMLIVRAANLMWPLARPDEASKLIDSVASTDHIVQQSLRAFRGLQLAMAARPDDAIAVAATLDRQKLHDLPALVAVWGLTLSLGDVGRTAEAIAIAEEGLSRAERSHDAPYQALSLTDFELTALLLAGRIHDAVRVADNVQRQWGDAPGLTAVAANAYAAMTALRHGRLDTARRQLTPAMGVFEAFGEDSALCDRFTIVHVELLARLGDAAAAAAALSSLHRRRHPAMEWFEPDRLLAASWVAAAQGAVTPAIATARQAADFARDHGQLTREVMCLQTATQFGDKRTLTRLEELKTMVDGPRAAAAAALADALTTGDGASLEAASVELEAMGDLFAAADAAAHAAVAHRAHDRRGAALTAAGRARRLAQDCGGAVSPVLRAAAQPIQLTPREREIISLVARGFSNREIAKTLTMSIRTVEGHLYRASQRLGISSRDDLAALIRDHSP
jgi:DNA-binding CsgD family transcriptional regulator